MKREGGQVLVSVMPEPIAIGQTVKAFILTNFNYSLNLARSESLTVSFAISMG